MSPEESSADTIVERAPARPRPAQTLGKRPRDEGRGRRRAKWLVIIVVLLVFAGVATIAGSYFYDSIPKPNELTLPNSTEIFASDGTTQLAALGSQNRIEIPISKLSPQVQKALIAGEDKHFYEHHGIDLWGIARAAWNNITGGQTQGGSTITQQYAREAAGDREISYARKLREAVMARKIEDTYTKDEILSFYLNSVYFGRGAHGIGAAAEAYFGIRPDKIDTLTVSQAAVLGAVLKQPEGRNGFDPADNPENAKDRWTYVLNNMVEMKWLTPAERAQLTYPAVQDVDKATAGGAWGYADRPTGYVIRYVDAELDKLGIQGLLRDEGLPDWKNAGLRITTTIDPRAQAALEAQLDRAKAGSAMKPQRENLIAAGVAIDPATGRVLAYYGGTDNGTDTDWAGSQEPHPPASSFKAYTLAAALADGISTQSLWDASELHKGVNGAEFDVSNAGREIDSLPCGTKCTLEFLTVKSFNVAFFKVARQIGPDKVVAMAHQAGIKTMWKDDPAKAYQLDAGIPQGRSVFDYQVGFGQYPISVLDHATGMATLADHGVYNQPHFVLRVERKNRQTGNWERIAAGDEQHASRRTIDQKVADEVTYVLKKIPADQGHTLANGRQVASKSGTWENGKKQADGVTPVFPGASAHAWYVGYTEQIATAIWVGSKDHNDTPIKDTKGNNIFGAGLPGDMWEAFMNKAHKDMQLPIKQMTNGTGGKLGDPNKGEFAYPPSPSPSPPRPTPSATQSPKPKPSKTPPPPPPTPTVTPAPQRNGRRVTASLRARRGPRRLGLAGE